MASLAIAALPVHRAAAILLAATRKSPTKAATTEVWEDDLLRLPRIDAAFFIRHCTDLSNLGVRNQFEGFANESLVPCGRGLAYASVLRVGIERSPQSRQAQGPSEDKHHCQKRKMDVDVVCDLVRAAAGRKCA
jgi:hypothetical protein